MILKNLSVKGIDMVRGADTERRWPVAVLILFVVVSLCSTVSMACNTTGAVYPPAMVEKVHEGTLVLESYLKKKNSPEQDKKMLKAVLKVFRSLDTVMQKKVKEK